MGLPAIPGAMQLTILQSFGLEGLQPCMSHKYSSGLRLGLRAPREGNVLFNVLTHFILYGIRHMVEDHLIVRKETCCHHIGYSFRLTGRVLLYAHATDRIAIPRPLTPVVEHFGLAQWVRPMTDRSDDPSHHSLLRHRATSRSHVPPTEWL